MSEYNDTELCWTDADLADVEETAKAAGRQEAVDRLKWWQGQAETEHDQSQLRVAIELLEADIEEYEAWKRSDE